MGFVLRLLSGYLSTQNQKIIRGSSGGKIFMVVGLCLACWGGMAGEEECVYTRGQKFLGFFLSYSVKINGHFNS